MLAFFSRVHGPELQCFFNVKAHLSKGDRNRLDISALDASF